VLLLTRHNGLGRTDGAGLGEVGLDRDEVDVRLEAGPQPDGSATAANSAMTDPIAFFWEDDVDGRPCRIVGASGASVYRALIQGSWRAGHLLDPNLRFSRGAHRAGAATMSSGIQAWAPSIRSQEHAP
jgi:hypothetical protein